MDILFLLLPVSLVAAEYFVAKNRKSAAARQEPCGECF
jgi:hypothetical protein